MKSTDRSQAIGEAAEASDLQKLNELNAGDLLWDLEEDQTSVKAVWLVDDLQPDLILLWLRPATTILAKQRVKLAARSQN